MLVWFGDRHSRRNALADPLEGFVEQVNTKNRTLRGARDRRNPQTPLEAAKVPIATDGWVAVEDALRYLESRSHPLSEQKL